MFVLCVCVQRENVGAIKDAEKRPMCAVPRGTHIKYGEVNKY